MSNEPGSGEGIPQPDVTTDEPSTKPNEGNEPPKPTDTSARTYAPTPEGDQAHKKLLSFLKSETPERDLNPHPSSSDVKLDVSPKPSTDHISKLMGLDKLPFKKPLSELKDVSWTPEQAEEFHQQLIDLGVISGDKPQQITHDVPDDALPTEALEVFLKTHGALGFVDALAENQNLTPEEKQYRMHTLYSKAYSDVVRTTYESKLTKPNSPGEAPHDTPTKPNDSIEVPQPTPPLVKD